MEDALLNSNVPVGRRRQRVRAKMNRFHCCAAFQAECVRTVNMVRALYSHCAQGEEGQYLGCVTDKIGQGSGRITLPVYANMCSAMCYEADQRGATKVHRCPYEGTRLHNPSLQRLFGR